MLSSKNMIIITVTLIQRWYSTRERNKQHIHYLKLERAIFILSHRGKYLRTYTAAYSGTVLSQLEIPMRVPTRKATCWKGSTSAGKGRRKKLFLEELEHSCKKWHFYSSLKPKIPLEIFYMQQLYANPSQV